MAKVSLQPLADKVLVRPGPEEQTTESGIILPDTARKKPQEGEVLAIGPGRWDEGKRTPMSVKIGDTVVYSKYGGTEITIRGEELVILDEEQILAVKTDAGRNGKKK